MTASFSAADSALGYLNQVRVALLSYLRCARAGSSGVKGRTGSWESMRQVELVSDDGAPTGALVAAQMKSGRLYLKNGGTVSECQRSAVTGKWRHLSVGAPCWERGRG
jgi:hypothetical protein